MPLEDFQKQMKSPFQSQPRKGDGSAVMSELVKRINQNARRIHFVEQKMERMESGMRSLDETVLMQLNELKLELDKIGNKIADVADRLTAVENEVLRINSRLDKTATKTEVKQLETFIDLINPITSEFITKDQLERALEERVIKARKRI
jgi:septal ring factor EnvC (AmiA/AmiB activator)